MSKGLAKKKHNLIQHCPGESCSVDTLFGLCNCFSCIQYLLQIKRFNNTKREHTVLYFVLIKNSIFKKFSVH